MDLPKIYRSYYYGMFDLQKLDAKAARLQNKASPIVTLTTTPNRITDIKPTLVSLLDQNLPPLEIHINLGADLFANTPIPFFLHNLKVVKIHVVNNDFGPATKLIPTLERFRGTNQLLIIVDDDMFYPKDLIKHLVDADKNAEGQKCCCANGLKIPNSLLALDCHGDRRIMSGSRPVAIMQGAGGYSIRANFLDARVLLDINNAPNRALFDDDVWFSGHLSRNNISKIQVPTSKRKSLANTLTSAITGNRIELMTELLKFFSKDWKTEEYTSIYE